MPADKAEAYGRRILKDPAVADQWFKTFVEKNPKYALAKPGEAAKAKSEAEKAKTEAEKAKPPITTGPPAKGKPKPVTGTGLLNGKTVKPGQPNSMSAQEYAEYKKANGISY